MAMFVRDQQYTREGIQKVLGLPPTKGDWYTGHHREGDDHYIFCGIDIPGRSGHSYNNYFDGNDLIWHPNKTVSANQPRFAHMLGGASVHVFYRLSDRDPFTYAGAGVPTLVKSLPLIEVRWRFVDENAYPDDIPNSPVVREGAKKQVTVNAYERDVTAKPRCLSRWGTKCVVCDFDFGMVYGPLGAGFIHVHHLRPLHAIGEEYELDPEVDLRPVCPNCHAMLHRKKSVLSIGELKAVLKWRFPGPTLRSAVVD
jgi:5-methylcytosine-specific restriction protein A